jgi:hypothetical protein
MSASTSQDPVITASGARNGSGHRILGERSPELKAEPKSITFTLQLFDRPRDKGSVEGSTRYCGVWRPEAFPRTSAVSGEPIDRSTSSADIFEILSSTSTMLPGCRSKAHVVSRLDDKKSRTGTDLHELYPHDEYTQSPVRPVQQTATTCFLADG